MLDLEALAEHSPDLAAALMAARNVSCRKSFARFVEHATPDFKRGWFTDALAAELQQFSRDVAVRRSPRLIISTPPRHGKTRHASECLPTWHLAQHPFDRVILTSYGLSLARESAVAARGLARSPLAADLWPRFHLQHGDQEKTNWKTSEGGGVLAAGVAGPITGRGAHLFVVDDPYKNHIEANNARHRDKVWKWFQSAANTRLLPGGGVLVIATRWHPDDLTGKLAAMGWRVVNFEAISTHDDGKRRAGEALHPDRYDLAALLKIKTIAGDYFWDALYQGRPGSPGGKVWPHEIWRLWTHDTLPTAFDRHVITCDLTFGATQGDGSRASMHVHGIVDGGDKPSMYVLEEYCERSTYPEQRAALLDLAQRYPRARVLYENKAAGKPLAQDLANVLGQRLEPVTPQGDKVTRAQSAAPTIRDGRVWLPAPGVTPWSAACLQELTEFPDHPHDDRVDDIGMAIRDLDKSKPGGFFFRSL